MGGGIRSKRQRDCAITIRRPSPLHVWPPHPNPLPSRSRIYPTLADLRCPTRASPSSGGEREHTEIAAHFADHSSSYQPALLDQKVAVDERDRQTAARHVEGVDAEPLQP